jgi:two-component system LytT family response regulator
MVRAATTSMKDTIRTLIVDDEPLARRGIRSHLASELDIKVIGECSNGLEALAMLRKEKPQLVFLDVQMPELDGFGVIEEIGVAETPTVIFVTAYDAHAIRAFEVEALDYVLKPFEPDRFRKAVARARSEIEKKRNGEINLSLVRLLEELHGLKYLTRLAIKSAGRVQFVSVSEVDWIEAADNYVRVHSGRESYLVRETMSSLETKLDPRGFARVHRSIIVNIARVRQLQTMFKGEYEIVMQDGRHLPFGRAYRSRVRQLITNSI